MKVMVIGRGGREHALVHALASSKSVRQVLCLPGSDGIASLAAPVAGDPLNPEEVLAAAARHAVDLVVIGPEAPLAAGLADALAEVGIPVFGPTRQGARLEWSKAYAKQFMVKYGIPTPEGRWFDDAGEAARYIRANEDALVVKADGLAAGKGVTVASHRDEALAAVDDIMVRGRFGTAGRRVVIEEKLSGREVSVLAVTDGDTYFVLPPACDYKSLYEGGRGPNTGGMGAYAPVPFAGQEFIVEVKERVLDPVMNGLKAEGIVYRGVIYAGLMVTEEGPRVLEFNCRFGDPETQVILPLLAGDFGRVFHHCASGTLGRLTPEGAAAGVPGWPLGGNQFAVTVVLASPGYPDAPRTGGAIRGLEGPFPPGVFLYHAGTVRDQEKVWRTAGGRVLNVTALAGSLEEARRAAYGAADQITFEGRQLRRDVARL